MNRHVKINFIIVLISFELITDSLCKFERIPFVRVRGFKMNNEFL